METGHAISVVKTNCFTAPRVSSTNRPASTREFQQEHYGSKGFGKRTLNGEESGVFGREKYGNELSTVGRHVHAKQQVTLTNNDNQGSVNDEQFYENLVKLREEHKKTLKLLETKYYSELRNQCSFQWEGFTDGVGLGQHNSFLSNSGRESPPGSPSRESQQQDMTQGKRVFHKPPKSPAVRDVVRDMSHDSTLASDHGEDSDDSDGENAKESEDLTRSPEEFSSSLFPKRSAAIDMVEELWKDFSVREYSTRNDKTEDETMDERDARRTAEEKEWSPAITVPKPFSMMLRETGKEKRKTRSMKMIEDDLNLKKSMEEAELKKKFRAQPVPATTFLPLYDEIMEKNNRRSEHVRELNKAILKATEKPFNFIKREQIKKQQKKYEKMVADRQKDQEKSEEKRSKFKAKPPPKNALNDLTLADRLTEQEEYRKIRTKLRAAELLTQSRLPPSMEARANLSPAAKSRKKCRRKHGEKTPTFRPNINHEIPDFEALHWEFEKDLRRKKKERQPTVTEPFNLQTAHIPHQERSLRRTRSMENLSGSTGSPGINRKPRPYSARLSSSQDTLPFGTTDSVRLRDSAVKKSLEMKQREELDMTKEMKDRRKREKQLRSQVSVKAMANDHSWQLKRTQDEKLRHFRESDRGRQEEYEQELAEMKRRVAERPLLLEQESRENAKKKAERKYTRILRDAGVDERLVSSLVAKGGGIIDDYDDSDADDVEDEDEDYTRGSREYPTGQQNSYLSDESHESDDGEPEYGPSKSMDESL